MKPSRTIPSCGSLLGGLLLGAVLLSSCSGVEERHPVQGVPLTFSSVATKGFVPDDELYDYYADDWRDILVSAYLHAQEGEDGDYFVASTFAHDDATSSWHCTPEEVYWPLGATMDFLALSTGVPLSAADITWGVPSAASRVRVAVPRTYLDDDILYGCAAGCASTDGPVAMTFRHAQAYIDVTVRLALNTTGDVRVSSVRLTDVYPEGDLTVVNDAGVAEASWSFRRFRAEDLELMPSSEPMSIPNTVGEILLPEQEQTSLVIDYTLDGAAHSRTIELPHERWIMGRAYSYDVRIKGTFQAVQGSTAPGIEVSLRERPLRAVRR